MNTSAAEGTTTIRHSSDNQVNTTNPPVHRSARPRKPKVFFDLWVIEFPILFLEWSQKMSLWQTMRRRRTRGWRWWTSGRDWPVLQSTASLRGTVSVSRRTGVPLTARRFSFSWAHTEIVNTRILCSQSWNCMCRRSTDAQTWRGTEGCHRFVKWLVTASARTLAKVLLRHVWASYQSGLYPSGPRGSWRSWWTLHPLPSWSRPHRSYQPVSNFSQYRSSRQPSSSSQLRPSRLHTYQIRIKPSSTMGLWINSLKLDIHPQDVWIALFCLQHGKIWWRPVNGKEDPKTSKVEDVWDCCVNFATLALRVWHCSVPCFMPNETVHW